MAIVVATVAALVPAACGDEAQTCSTCGAPSSGGLPNDAAADSNDAGRDVDVDSSVSDGSGTGGAGGTPDASGDMGADDAKLPPHVPTGATAELIFAGPGPVSTPPTWNAHLPKLVGDDDFLYAAHTHFPQDIAGRFTAVMRRPRGGGSWTEVARVSYPHQHVGLAMDTSSRLHMVFDCLRPAGAPVSCFTGGAGTGSLTSRFYHLVFSARDASGALRFDAYANRNEWTSESNGYLGLGTAANGTTWWALADSAWNRVVQYQEGSNVGTVTTLSVPPGYLLYPILAAPGASSPDTGLLVLYAGEFDPSGGNNASYVASTGYSGSVGGLSQLFRRAPATPQPGTSAAFPSDLTFDNDGTLLALSRLAEGPMQCTELLRFDGGLGAAPTVIKLGCLATYAKLQVASNDALYLLTNGQGQSFRVGVSADRGDNWEFHDVPITGLPSNGDVSFRGMTPVKPYTSASLYDPDVMRFFFSGADGSGTARHSYYAEIALTP